MDRKDIPGFCFLSAQFLIMFDRNKTKPPYSLVHQEFLNNIETTPRLDDFPYMHPGMLVMLCYGLVVYPIELWNSFLKDEMSMERLKRSIILSAKDRDHQIKTFIDLFQVIIPNKSLAKSDFIRRFRHSIAHSNIDFDSNYMSFFTFWNVNRQEEVDFKVSVSTEKLGIFLTGVAKHFNNFQRNIC